MTALLWCYRHHYECDGRAENAFTKWLPWMFPTSLQLLAEVYNCTRGNVTYMIVLLVISHKSSDSGTILKLPRSKDNLSFLTGGSSFTGWRTINILRTQFHGVVRLAIKFSQITGNSESPAELPGFWKYPWHSLYYNRNCLGLEIWK